MKKIFSLLLVLLLVFSLSAEENKFSLGVSLDTLGMIEQGLKFYDYSSESTVPKCTTAAPFIDAGINFSVAYKVSEEWKVYGKAGLDYVALKLLSINGPELVLGKGLPLWAGFGADRYLKTVNIFDVPVDIRAGADVSYYDWMPGDGDGTVSRVDDNVAQVLDICATLSANCKNAFCGLSVGYRNVFGTSYKISDCPVCAKLTLGMVKDF